MAEVREISDALAEKNRFKSFNKKHPRELAACFSNLGHIVELLNYEQEKHDHGHAGG